MRRYILLFILNFWWNISFCQNTVFVWRDTLAYYENSSIQLEKVVRDYKDTLYNLFGCTGASRLKIVERYHKGENSRFTLNCILLIDDDVAEIFTKHRYCILMVDSMPVLISLKSLDNLLSLEQVRYLGRRPFELKYESFESCLHKLGVLSNFEFISTSDGEVFFDKFYFYKPEKPHKSISNLRKKR